jgi:hypothetical protein
MPTRQKPDCSSPQHRTVSPKKNAETPSGTLVDCCIGELANHSFNCWMLGFSTAPTWSLSSSGCRSGRSGVSTCPRDLGWERTRSARLVGRLRWSYNRQKKIEFCQSGWSSAAVRCLVFPGGFQQKIVPSSVGILILS